MAYDIRYRCSHCGNEYVRKAGCFYTANVPECCGSLMRSELVIPGLLQISARPCSIVGCENTATWAKDGATVCIEDMKQMASMNNDDADYFAPALSSTGG